MSWYINTVPSTKGEDCCVYEIRKRSGELVAWVQSENDANMIIVAHEMHKLLKEMDFIETIDLYGDAIIFCPICESYGSDHNKGCRLQEILTKLEVQAE